MTRISREDRLRSLLDGRRLAAELRRGAELPAVDLDVVLEADEKCHDGTYAQLFEWRAGDGAYVHRTGGWIGPRTAVVVGAVNVVGNALRRAAADRAAAAQWRAIDQGFLLVTNRRVAVQGDVRWTDIMFSQIRRIDCQPGSIFLEISQQPRMRIDLERAHYWFVMLKYLLHGAISDLPELKESEDERTGAVAGDLQFMPQKDVNALTADRLMGAWESLDNGYQRLQFDPYGRLSMHRAGSDTVGIYRVRGSELELRSDDEMPTTYTWSVDGDLLTLTADKSETVYHRA